MLKVFLKDPKQERPITVWQLSGYHGNEWSVAHIAWSGASAVQVGKGTRRKPIRKKLCLARTILLYLQSVCVTFVVLAFPFCLPIVKD